MITMRGFVAVTVASAALCASPAAGQDGPCFTGFDFAITQAFPAAGPEMTRWEVSGCAGAPNGLIIGTTRFRKTPQSAPIQVFHDARVSEIFVPYHNSALRAYDISEVSRGPILLGDVECPPGLGTRYAHDTVCAELRDRGLAWKVDANARRGQELVVWGVIDALNYKYIIEWTFRDDGVILGRVGATGRNAAGPLHEVSHMHTVTWRLDIDLDGPDGDSARIGRHVEPAGSLTAQDFEPVVVREKGIAWLAPKFTTLNIYDVNLTNAQGKRSSYQLVPLRLGTARHVEPHTTFDFWVTRANAKGTELRARDLPSYIDPPQTVEATDIIVWYNTSCHHVERDEDDNGATQAMWVGFMLKPHDLFDGSPLFP